MDIVKSMNKYIDLSYGIEEKGDRKSLMTKLKDLTQLKFLV